MINFQCIGIHNGVRGRLADGAHGIGRSLG